MVKKGVTFLLLIVPFFAAIAVQAQNSLGSQFKLLPIPQKIELQKGTGISYNTLTSFRLEGQAKKPVLDDVLGNLEETSTAGKGTVVFKLDSISEFSSPEGYILSIENGYVTIIAEGQAGLFYGAQTLSQLIEDARDQKIAIPACRITDYPDINYRAIHLDLKHHLDSLSYYYQLMDRLADIKVNAVIIEFEDKLKYERSPVVGASHAISIKDFEELSHYAHDRNIEISPLVQGLGHASFILKHPEFRELRDDSISDWSFDPLNPATYDVQFNLYLDAIQATPYGKYLHIGGDEVGKLGMSERAKKSGLKPIELQMHWLTMVCDFAKQHGRIPIFWDDMVFKLSNLYETTYDPSIPVAEVEKRWQENEKLLNENINLFPKSCVYMRWSYDHPTLPGNLKALEWYKKNNLSAMAATSGQQIWPMLPREHSNFQPVKDFSRITAEQNLDRILLTLWDDTSPHFETFWRGIYNFGLFTWNYQDIKMDDAFARFRHRFYGPKLSNPAYAFQDRLEQSGKFWETALIEKGDRDNYPKEIHSIVLPAVNEAGSWSAKNTAKLEAAKNQVKQYEATKKIISRALQDAVRNKYALEIFQQLNELQVYPAKLLLKLGEYDKAKPGDKSKAAKNVKDYVQSFDALRKSYEQLTTRTRVLHNPDDYVPDQNHHHHLANGTNNSNWMYVYELALNRAIQEQLSN
ncbi:MAG: beta-N-acetylhexosaminidase [Chitinophagaceae bacterium]|nr:beta-N-acetylhexosaminidase [Chitinophagaceae bacterium]